MCEGMEIRGSSADLHERSGFTAMSCGFRATPGYRDLQLSITLHTEDTRGLQVHQHVAEVQLHLAAIAALKSAGGHKLYVRCRNMRSE